MTGRRARVEGEAARSPKTVTAGQVTAIGAAVEAFKAQFPDEWEALRLCPLQHGLEDMERLLKG